MRCAGHVAHMGKMRNYTKFWSGNLKGRDHLEGLGVGGRIILYWILGKYGGKIWTGFILLSIGTSGRRL